jgi:type I restriction enzyme S subunit
MENNQISKLELIQAQVSFIPDGWKLDKVGKTLVIKNTFRKPISQEVRSKIPGCYPYYGPTKIQDYISDYEQDGVYALIGEDGDHFLKYSTMRQTQFISGKCTVNNHAHIIESSDECDSEWFYIFFKHRNITNFLSRQGAGRFKLNKATLEKLPLLVPPLPEQRKIANILGAWDKAISTTERLIDNSKQQKKALMQQLLTGKKRLLDDSGKPFEGEWEWCTLDKVSDVKGGKRLPKGNSLTDIPNSHPYIRVADMFMGGVDVKNILYVPEEVVPSIKNYTISKDDLFITVAGTLGIVGEIPPLLDGANLTENADKLTNISCNKKFLLYVLRSPIIQRYVDAESTQNAQPKLALARIRSFKVPLPKPIEQQKIASVLTNADKEIELLEKQLADLKQEKKALMQQLLTGKRRVKV